MGLFQDGLVISTRFLVGVRLVMLSFVWFCFDTLVFCDIGWVLPQEGLFKGVMRRSRKEIVIPNPYIHIKNLREEIFVKFGWHPHCEKLRIKSARNQSV